ncbi:MAG: hypothetical protein J6W14_07300, partial [Clostridia bacterium]|nr:hypothetical protein [Clostridia bacterium]
MDVIIFSGQSNMQGQSECLSEHEIVAGAYEYKWLSDTLVPLQNPVGENITYSMTQGRDFMNNADLSDWLVEHVAGAACYGHTNLVPSFCKTYVKRTGREVLAVHVAKGSTEIADWLPGTPGYEIIKKKSCAAIQKTHPQHIYFVWLQGESDAVAGNTKEYYKDAIQSLCYALKQDIGIELFGIIRVGRFTNDERDVAILVAQDEVCLENRDFAMLTRIATELNEKSTYMHP